MPQNFSYKNQQFQLQFDLILIRKVRLISFHRFLLFLNMRKFSILLSVSICFFLSECNSPETKTPEKSVAQISRNDKDTFQLLCQFWQLVDADNPTSKDVTFTNNEIKFESGIVFMTDSTFLENPAGEMTYGKFKLDGSTVTADFDDGRHANYKIEMLSPDSLLLTRLENKHSSFLNYKATHTYWKNAEKCSFAKENYQWVKKPAKPETDQEIKNRAKNCVQFYAYYFQGFVNGEAQKINFEALPCCFNWYQGGIFIQSEKTLDKKWKNCFYSEEQAFTARQLLQDALSKKYDWDTTETNWLVQTAKVLQQIHDGM